MNKWTIQDRYGNTIYLTEERWRHILESRPELGPCHDEFLETIRTGQRRQDALIPNEYRYFRQCEALLPENNSLIAVVIFKTSLGCTRQLSVKQFRRHWMGKVYYFQRMRA